MRPQREFNAHDNDGGRGDRRRRRRGRRDMAGGYAAAAGGPGCRGGAQPAAHARGAHPAQVHSEQARHELDRGPGAGARCRAGGGRRAWRAVSEGVPSMFWCWQGAPCLLQRLTCHQKPSDTRDSPRSWVLGVQVYQPMAMSDALRRGARSAGGALGEAPVTRVMETCCSECGYVANRVPRTDSRMPPCQECPVLKSLPTERRGMAILGDESFDRAQRNKHTDPVQSERTQRAQPIARYSCPCGLRSRQRSERPLSKLPGTPRLLLETMPAF
jgi:hypothetical protein